MKLNRKILGLAIALIMLFSSTIPAFAAMPIDTVIVENKAYDFEYFQNNAEAILDVQAALDAGENVYVKFDGGILNVVINEFLENSEELPEVEYYDKDGNVTRYEAGDGDPVESEFKVIEISAIEDITVEFGGELVLPKTVKATLDNEEATEVTLAIEWAENEEFDAEVAGDYTFTGTLSKVEGEEVEFTIPEDKATVTVKVTVEEEVVEALRVESVSAINNTKTIVVTLEEAVANAKFDVTFVDEDEEITEIGVESAIADEDNLVYTLVLADLDGKKGTLVVNEVELAIDYSATALTAAINNAKAKATAAKGKAIDSAEAKALLAALEAPVLNAVDVIDEAVTYYATDIDTNKSVINSRARLQAAIARANAEYAEDEQEAAEELQELVDDVNSATNLADLLDALEALEIENAIYDDSGTDKLYFPLAYFDAIEAGAPLVDKAAIQAVVDAVNLAEVTKLVEKAEETMDADDVEAAEGYLELFEEEVAEAFQERLDAVTAAIEEAELIDAVNEAVADAALLTALQALETAELIENVDEDNKEAYFAALETLQEDAEFAFESVEEIQAFVDKVNADELVAVVDALIDAVNEADADAALLTALQALETAELIENVDEDNKEAYFAALETLQEDEDFAFEKASEIQVFVDGVNLEVAIKAVNDATNAAGIFAALDSEVLDLDNVVARNTEVYASELEALVEADAEFEFTTPAEIQAFVNAANATPVGLVNTAKNTTEMRAALENAELELDLAVYNELTSLQKNLLAQGFAKDDTAYANAAEIQGDLDDAVIELLGL